MRLTRFSDARDRIYAAVGCEPVIDVDRYRFVASRARLTRSVGGRPTI